MSGSFSDTDRGYKRLMKAITAAARVRITVGIHQEEDGGKAEGSTVLEVAEINEYGLGVPARPAISTFANTDTTAKLAFAREHAAAGLESGRPIAESLDQVAQVWAADIQEMYSAGLSPENAKATVDKKGSSKPRIDTGQERSSIRGRVEVG